MMYCPFCGAAVTQGLSYCKRRGCRVVASEMLGRNKWFMDKGESDAESLSGDSHYGLRKE